METGTVVTATGKARAKRVDWLRTAAVTAVFSVGAVLLVQFTALTLRPDLALFKPLDSYPRTALFTLIPALVATALFAWLARRGSDPVRKFVAISAGVLLLSFIPDYAAPLQGKTLGGSTVAALMHAVAGVVTVATIVSTWRGRKEG